MTAEATTDASPPPGRGLITFYLLLVTEAVSALGSQISSFAVGIWLFRETGQATPLALIWFFQSLSQVLAATFAGPLADHVDRRRLMLIAEIGMATTSTLLLVSFVSGAFQVWHLYVLTFAQAAFATLQGPAFQASTTMLVPDAHRDRANAAQMISGPAAGVLGPAVTGVLYAVIGVTGAIVADIATFVLAALVLAVVRIPQPPESAAGSALVGGIGAQLLVGFRYLFARMALLGLCAFFSLINFLALLGFGVLTPYTLDRLNDTAKLGLVLSALNVGAVAGGVLMTVWGGTRPRIHTIMLGVLIGSAAIFLFGVARNTLTMAASLFVFGATSPMINAPFFSILQAKVAPDVQGRVFAAITQVTGLITPLALLLSGPLADRVFEPARTTAAWRWIAPLVGSGKGAGIGLMFVSTGVLLIVLSLAVYASNSIRRLEDTLPDNA
jgi:DHA3 family macrolide efflux protein-like MFS transporter